MCWEHFVLGNMYMHVDIIYMYKLMIYVDIFHVLLNDTKLLQLLTTLLFYFIYLFIYFFFGGGGRVGVGGICCPKVLTNFGSRYLFYFQDRWRNPTIVIASWWYKKYLFT